MDLVLWTKKIAGNEWLPVGDAFQKWLDRAIDRLPAGVIRDVMRKSFEGKKAKEIAAEMGFKVGSVNNVIVKGHMILAGMLGDDRSMFRSIREFQFSEEVDGFELGMCIYGRWTRNIQEAYLPKVKAGKLDLPAPVWKSGKYVWTREQAEKWRDWYCDQRG